MVTSPLFADTTLAPADMMSVAKRLDARRNCAVVVPYDPRGWKDVRFMCTVVIRKTGVTGAGAKAQRILGRAFGERNDGQCFYAGVDLPWILTDHRFQWTKVARKRLDTFCDKRCTCYSRGEDQVYCWWHRDIMRQWQAEDDARCKDDKGLDGLPYSPVATGPVPQYIVMNKDYPWIKRDPEMDLMRCVLCGAFDQWTHIPSYQNRFILKHSHCGFRPADPIERNPTPGRQYEDMPPVMRNRGEVQRYLEGQRDNSRENPRLTDGDRE